MHDNKKQTLQSSTDLNKTVSLIFLLIHFYFSIEYVKIIIIIYHA